LQELTPAFLKDFLLFRNPEGKASLGKALVWTLRKFGAHLALLQRLDHNPAAVLSHPKISPRNKLPQYITATQLRQLPDSASTKRPLRDFTVLSLPATVGARPSEIVTLKKAEVNIGDQYLMLQVKGNWFKRSPISNSMAELLDQYLHSIDKDQQHLFLNE
jgi:site-specific recombinase XerC